MAGPGTEAGARSSSPTAARWLTAEDRSILALETETVAGHTCKVIVLADPIDPARLRGSIAARLPGVVPLHLRLAEADGRPCWVEEPVVDLSAHVVVDGPDQAIGDAGLRATVARVFEQRLDRTRPLWRIDIVPRLERGGSALIWRLHHAVADGATFMRVAQAVLWDEPAASDPARATVPHRGSRPVAPESGRRRHALEALAREAPHPWHRTPFNGHIDARRSVAFASVDLNALRRAARATDHATVNDAVLTVVSGGLRRWLESMHGRLGPIRVKVPVSLHHVPGPEAGDGEEPGNRDSFFCLDLPLGPEDPVARLAEVRRSTRVRKEGHDAEHLDALMIRLGHVPHLRGFAEHVLAHPRSFALNVSNVPGPRRPVTVTGIPVRSLHSLAEIREHHALRVAVVSLADRLHFGMTADPTLLAGVDRLAADLGAEADALLAATGDC
jgi:Wax ester synthase/diacylglycerol acyltransferase catalytic domain/WS/DGAT C-terminal domain